MSCTPKQKSRIALLCLFLSTVGCYSGNNPMNCNRNKDFPLEIRGLSLANAQGPFSMKDVAPGETFTLPIQVLTMVGEYQGATSRVTPDLPAGFTVTPLTIDITLPTGEAAAYANFTVTAPTQIEGTGSLTIGAHRHTTLMSKEALVTQDRSVTFVPGLVAANLTPPQATLPQGQTANFSAAITPRGNTQGPTPLKAVISPARSGVSISPTTFSPNLTQGATTPITQAFTVSATSNATTGPTFVEIQTADGYVLDRSPLTISARTGGSPRFTIAASKQDISVPLHTLSEEVSFTVTSFDGFSGLVTITWATENDMAVAPPDNNFQVEVRPGFPARFNRKFYRYDYSDAPNYMSFAAQSTAIGRTEQISITVRKAN